MDSTLSYQPPGYGTEIPGSQVRVVWPQMAGAGADASDPKGTNNQGDLS